MHDIENVYSALLIHLNAEAESFPHKICLSRREHCNSRSQNLAARVVDSGVLLSRAKLCFRDFKSCASYYEAHVWLSVNNYPSLLE
jgi:hypothetical protein